MYKKKHFSLVSDIFLFGCSLQEEEEETR